MNACGYTSLRPDAPLFLARRLAQRLSDPAKIVAELPNTASRDAPHLDSDGEKRIDTELTRIPSGPRETAPSFGVWFEVSGYSRFSCSAASRNSSAVALSGSPVQGTVSVKYN